MARIGLSCRLGRHLPRWQCRRLVLAAARTSRDGAGPMMRSSVQRDISRQCAGRCRCPLHATCVNTSSDRTAAGGSVSISPLIRSRTASASDSRRRASPPIGGLKKYFSSKRPRGVAMNLLVVTRLTVLSCISMASAMSRRISGLRCRTPCGKNRLLGTISVATFRMVFARWCSVFTSQFAASMRSVR